eukprot:699951_1
MEFRPLDYFRLTSSHSGSPTKKSPSLPSQVVSTVLESISGFEYNCHKCWIHLSSEEYLLKRAGELESIHSAQRYQMPLFSVPFAVKDNIDVAGVPTTAACPDYSYIPEKSAPVVQRLIDAGAIFIGKTNLDQFATGLVGVRSPHGACRNACNPEYISGGSSSGSAVSVALGIVCFALGTDTAGSGRVPAALNNIVGLKPTRGLCATTGVVPACRSLDCVSVFAGTCADALSVMRVMQGVDSGDPYSRLPPKITTVSIKNSSVKFRFGVPRIAEREFFGNHAAEALFSRAIERLGALGGACVEIDYEPFKETADLLYEGPWVAERLAAIGDFLVSGASVLPVTRKIIESGKSFSAVDCFRAQYKLQELCRKTELVWNDIDILVVPSVGTIYTIAEVERDPVQLN